MLREAFTEKYARLGFVIANALGSVAEIDEVVFDGVGRLEIE
ncbi:MAG: hypothetical protein AAFU85_12735 [Planctomycetota bacterium]